MKEENIRPKHLMEEHEKLRDRDIAKLLSRQNEFVKVPCPACESADYKEEFEKKGFNFVRCKNCETLFISPRPTFEMLEDFYEKSESIKFWSDKIYAESEGIRRDQIFVPRAKRVGEICQKFGATGTIMDVGAGFGNFLEEVGKLKVFKKLIAVEPSPDLAAVCRKKGQEVIEQVIEKINTDEKVDVIVNFELIEHLFRPKDFIQACAKLLTGGGLFIVTTPNIKGFDLLTLGKLSGNITGPNHINYFHPKSLSILLENCGFEVVEVLTPGKLDAELVRKKILNGEFDASDYPFLSEILIGKWETAGEKFQNFLAENQLSSHMWIVARKR